MTSSLTATPLAQGLEYFSAHNPASPDYIGGAFTLNLPLFYAMSRCYEPLRVLATPAGFSMGVIWDRLSEGSRLFSTQGPLCDLPAAVALHRCSHEAVVEELRASAALASSSRGPKHPQEKLDRVLGMLSGVEALARRITPLTWLFHDYISLIERQIARTPTVDRLSPLAVGITHPLVRLRDAYSFEPSHRVAAAFVEQAHAASSELVPRFFSADARQCAAEAAESLEAAVMVFSLGPDPAALLAERGL